MKSVGIHAGARFSWFHSDAPESDSLNGYGGAEVQLPARLYLVGEISTRGETSTGAEKRIPFAFGMQWRLRAVNLSVAMIQRGNDAELGLYSGVAFGHAF